MGVKDDSPLAAEYQEFEKELQTVLSLDPLDRMQGFEAMQESLSQQLQQLAQEDPQD